MAPRVRWGPVPPHPLNTRSSPAPHSPAKPRRLHPESVCCVQHAALHRFLCPQGLQLHQVALLACGPAICPVTTCEPMNRWPHTNSSLRLWQGCVGPGVGKPVPVRQEEGAAHQQVAQRAARRLHPPHALRPCLQHRPLGTWLHLSRCWNAAKVDAGCATRASCPRLRPGPLGTSCEKPQDRPGRAPLQCAFCNPFPSVSHTLPIAPVNHTLPTLRIGCDIIGVRRRRSGRGGGRRRGQGPL